jgi:hypothetical protein
MSTFTINSQPSLSRSEFKLQFAANVSAATRWRDAVSESVIKKSGFPTKSFQLASLLETAN